MVGKDGQVQVNQATFIKLSRLLGANVCLDYACTRFISSGTDANIKLENGKQLRIKFVPQTAYMFSIFFPREIYMLYFDIRD